MSEHGPITPRQEPEDLHGPRVATVLIAVLTLFAVSCAIVFGLERHWSKSRIAGRGAEVPAQVTQAKINLIEQVPFKLADQSRRAQDDARKRLATWGWADRDAGVAYEPVGVAIDSLLEEERR